MVVAIDIVMEILGSSELRILMRPDACPSPSNKQKDERESHTYNLDSPMCFLHCSQISMTKSVKLQDLVGLLSKIHDGSILTRQYCSEHDKISFSFSDLSVRQAVGSNAQVSRTADSTRAASWKR